MMAAMSRLGLGCWAFGGVGAAASDAAASRAIMLRAAELGVTHMDTAADYGDGISERVVGSAAAQRPGSFFVATKSQLLDTAKEAVDAVELARSRLGLETIDLFYIHWPRRGVDPAPMIEGLEACRRKGLLRCVGVSNFSVSDMEAASRAGRIDYHELCWNLLWRRPELDIAGYCASRGIGIVVYSPLAQGLLTDSGGDPAKRRADDPRSATLYHSPAVWPRLAPIVGRLREAAAGYGVGLGALALRWALSRPGVGSVLAGASSIAQLEANVAAAAAGPLEGGILADLEALSAEADAVLPKEESNIFHNYP